MRAGCWPTSQRDHILSMLGTSIFSSNSHFVLSQQQLLSLLSLSSSWKMVPAKPTDWAAEELQPTEGRMWLRLCSDPMASLRKPIWWWLLFVWFLLGDFLKVLPHWPFPPSLPFWGFASWAIRTTEIEVRVLLGSWHTVLNQVKRMWLGTTSWRQRRSWCSLEYVLFHLQTPVCIIILFLLSFKR